MKHFGKFSDKEIEFGDGLNVIEGENEAGKSTLHAFIRGMLFGIEKTRGRTGKGDIYGRYLPWDTPGAYQGSLDLEHDGRNIRISRVFLQNAKNCVITDLDTGEIYDWGDEGITALIRELSLSAFDNTVSCAQQQLKSKDDFGNYIRTYIANMSDSRDSQVDVATALEKLDDKAKVLSRKIRESGEETAQEELNSLLEDEKDESYIIADRDEALEVIGSLEDELENLKYGNGNNLHLNRGISGKEHRSSLARDLSGSYENADPNEDINEDINENNRDLIQKRYDRLQSLSGELKDTARAEKDISILSTKVEDARRRLYIIDEKLKERETARSEACEETEVLRKELDGVFSGDNDPEVIGEEADEAARMAEERRSSADSLKEKISVQREKVRKMLVSGSVLSIVGLAAAYFSSEKLKIGIIAGILLMLAGLIILLIGCVESKAVKNAEKEIASVEQQYLKDAERAALLHKKLHSLNENIAEVNRRLQQAELKLKDCESSCRETIVEREMTAEQLDELEDSIMAENAEFQRRKNNILRELEVLGLAVSKLADSRLPDETGSDFCSGGTAAETDDPAGHSGNGGTDAECSLDISRTIEIVDHAAGECRNAIDAYDSEQKRLETALTEKNRELARIEGTLLRYGDIGERIDEASKKLEEIKTEKYRSQIELEAIRQAAAAIREISDELKGSFDRRINSLLSRSCAQVTAGKYTQARITYGCAPEVLGDSGYLQVKDLSVGTGEQIFLAFRLAMSEFLFGKTEIPMIFDEVFAYYDDERLRSALEAVSNLGSRQVFLFTCSHREKQILDELGIEYKSISL